MKVIRKNKIQDSKSNLQEFTLKLINILIYNGRQKINMKLLIAVNDV
jgi:hypothetical protein